MKYLTVDDVYNVIGQFGFSQKLYYFGQIPLGIFLAFHMLLNVFTGLDPTFKCYPKNGTAKDAYLTDQCFNNRWQDCRLSYTSHYNSFASEWNLICNEKYKVALVQSIWMAGVMSGALLLGGAADAFGRSKTLMVTLLGTIAFEGFSSFAPTYLVLVVIRFFGGMCCALVILSGFVLTQELIGTDYRSWCGIMLSSFFAIGIAVFSAMASISSDWRTFSFICAASGILCLYIPWMLPESPRWLLTKGHQDEAKKILEKMARKNGKLDELPTHWEISLNGGGGNTTKKKSQGVRDLFTHPAVLVLTLIQIYSWFVNSATYYALTMAASDLGGNVYVSTALSGLIEIPSCLMALAVIDRLGRRITLCGFMLIGGVACVCIQFIPPSYVTLTTGFALCGKLSIAASFSVIYVHSAEIFPTPIRNSAMGIVSVAARVGGIVAPLILMLGDVVPNLQFTTLGSLTLIAGVLNLKLPETMGQPMPETVADILSLKQASKGGGVGDNEDYQYKKLQMDDEEVDMSAPAKTLNPSSRIKGKSDDQVPLIQDEAE